MKEFGDGFPLYVARTCGTCRHWRPFGSEESHHRDVEGFGTCGKAEMYDSYDHKEVAKRWQFCVIDGSDYFAALKTRESFGCNQWEAKENPTFPQTLDTGETK